MPSFKSLKPRGGGKVSLNVAVVSYSTAGYLSLRHLVQTPGQVALFPVFELSMAEMFQPQYEPTGLYS